MYVGLKVHSDLISKVLIQRLHILGISVSYERIMKLEEDILRATCTQYYNEGAVCTNKLRMGLPIFGIIDNIDINPTSIPQGSFHGTIISLFQTPKSNIGIERVPLAISEANKHSELPDSYSIVSFPEEVES